MEKRKLTRVANMGHDVLFVDGISGSGKSMLGPILSSFTRVETQRLEHVYEHLAGTWWLGAMCDDACQALLSLYSDSAIYDQMIAREVNFRPNDHSSVFQNPHSEVYLERLAMPDGDSVVERIRRERPILQIMSHCVLPFLDVLREAFGSRLRMVVMFRHPVYMVRHWLGYVHRYGTDVRELTLSYAHGGAVVPWFARGLEDEYLRGSALDRTVLSISRLLNECWQKIDESGEGVERVVCQVPFERFVREPHPYLCQLAGFLDCTPTETTAIELLRQKVPRHVSTAGLGHERYRFSGADASNETEEFESRACEIRSLEARPETLSLLADVCDRYTKRYELHHLPRLEV